MAKILLWVAILIVTLSSWVVSDSFGAPPTNITVPPLSVGIDLIPSLNPDIPSLLNQYSVKIINIKDAANYVNRAIVVKNVRVEECGYPNSNYLFLWPLRTDSSDIPPHSGILLSFELDGLSSEVIKAYLRLTYANPVSIERDLSFLVHEVNREWDSNSFSSLCISNYCYKNPYEVVGASPHKVFEATGRVAVSSALNDRQVLLVDITSLVKEWQTRRLAKGSLFLELFDDVQDDGIFGSHIFFGLGTDYVALQPKIEILLTKDSTEFHTKCGDNICAYDENCKDDCEAPADLTPPSFFLETSRDWEFVPTPGGGYWRPVGDSISIAQPGESITLTVTKSECTNSADSSNNGTTNIINFNGVPSINLEDLGIEISPWINEIFLDNLLLKQEPAQVMLWETGRLATPKNIVLCANNSCECSVTLQPSWGPHVYCARVIDEYGNMSEVKCRNVYVGSGAKPVIRYQVRPRHAIIPYGTYPGSEFDLEVRVTQPLGISQITKVAIKVQTSDNRTVLDEVVNMPANTHVWNDTLFFAIPCDILDVRPTDPKFVSIIINAENIEGQKNTAWGTMEISRPIQMEYGFPFVNSHGADLCWDEYHSTFGDEIYVAATICKFPPSVVSGCIEALEKYAGCYCVYGTPGSGLQEFVKIIGGWLTEQILKLVEIDDDLESFFCVDNLDDVGVPSITSLFYYPFYRYLAASQGRCTGFTAGTATMFKTKTYSSVWPGTSEDICTWQDNGQVEKFINVHQGSVISHEFISRLLNNFANPASVVIAQMEQELKDGRHGGISILGWPDANSCKPTGHTLFVDHIEKNRNGSDVKVYVYDSNRPYRAACTGKPNLCGRNPFNFPYIEFDLAADDFSFLMQSGNVWSRGYTGTCLMTIDLSEYHLPVLNINYTERMGGVPLYLPVDLVTKRDYKLPDIGELLDENSWNFLLLFIGNSDVEIQDQQGRSISTSGQRGNEPIPNGAIFNMPGGEGSGLHLAILPSTGQYTIDFHGREKKGQFIALLGHGGKGASLIASRDSAARFKFTEQNGRLQLSFEDGLFSGSLNFIKFDTKTIGELVNKGDFWAEPALRDVQDVKVEYSTLSSLHMVLQDPGYHFSLNENGTLDVELPKERSLSLHVLSNKPAKTVARPLSLQDIVNTEHKNVLLLSGSHQINFDPNLPAFERIQITGPYKINGAPASLQGACSLANPCDMDSKLVFAGPQKRRVSIVPEMQVPQKFHEQVGSAYLLIYWKEQDLFLQLTNDGLILFENELVPYLHNVKLSKNISFPIIEPEVDLTGLAGTFDIFMGVATKEDLSDLVYNWYELEFK